MNPEIPGRRPASIQSDPYGDLLTSPTPPAASTPLQRPKFSELLNYARPGDTAHISEKFRLVRGTQHMLDVLDALRRRCLALRVQPLDGTPSIPAQRTTRREYEIVDHGQT